MPKYKCTVTVSVTTVKEVTEVIEIDAPDEVTAEEDARTAAELIDEDTWDTNPNQSDSYIEGFDVDDVEIEELKESLKEDDEIDDYNQYIKRTTSKDFQDSEKNNDSDSQLLKAEDNFELKKKIEHNEIIFNKIKDCVTKKPPDFNQAYKIFFENNSDEFSSKILNLENLGKIYLKIAEKKNTILIAEAERLHKTAFELCQKGGRYDYGSSYTLARFYIEGIGTKQSFIKGQDTLLISYNGMPENTDKEKELKGSRALQISNTFQKKDPDGWEIYEEAKEDLKTAKTWILRAKELGRIYKIDEKIEELEQKISFQKTNQDSQKNYESKKNTNINKEIKSKPKEIKSKPIESYDGQDLKYMQDILIDYFNQNKSFFGGYKTIKYSELATYLTSRHIVELREGNKAAAKLGIIRPMQIPTAVLATGPFKIEQVGGWDALGNNIYITIKK